MKREVAGQLLAKSMIGLSLIGASALWVLDSYVEVDMMQQATASVSDEQQTLTPVLDNSGQPVQLAQTVRGNVKLNRVKIAPGLKGKEEEVDEALKPLESPNKNVESETLQIPQINMGLQEEKKSSPAMVKEPTLEELIDEIRAAKDQAAQPSVRVPLGDQSISGAGSEEEEEEPLSLGPSRLERKHPEVDIPAPVKLPNERELACNQELNLYEAQLIARERSLVKAYEALQAEKNRVLKMQAIVEEKWDDAQESWTTASMLVNRSEEVCVGPPPSEKEEALDLGLDEVDPEVRVTQVVQIVKSMKPKAAAQVIARWDSPLAATALKRLSPRVSSKILAELPQEVAQKLTVDLVKGKEHRYEGAPATDAPTP